jgi:hypothetical protein
MPQNKSTMKYWEVRREATPKNKRYSGRMLGAVQRPEGLRFYLGQGESRDMQMSIDKAKFDIERKAVANPADSVRTKNLIKILHPGEFEKIKQRIKTSRPSYL